MIITDNVTGTSHTVTLRHADRCQAANSSVKRQRAPLL